MMAMRFFKRWLGGAALVLGLSCGWPASSAWAEDLLDVHQLAEANDALFEVAKNRRDRDQEALPQSLAALLPSLVVSADKSYVKQRTVDDDSYTTSGYAVNLNVPVFHWDRVVGYRQSKKQVTLADLRLAGEERSLMMRTAQRYFDLLSAGAGVRFARAEEQANRRRLARVRAEFDAGTAVVMDLREAQAGHDVAVAQLIADDNRLISSREALNEVIGGLVKEVNRLAGKIPLVIPDPPEMDDWVELAEQHNDSLQQARLQAEIASQGLSKARAGHYPTVDVVGGRTYSDNNGSATRFGGTAETDSVTVQASLPIFQGGGTLSKVRQAVHGSALADNDLIRVRRQVVRQTRDAFRNLRTRIAQVQAFGRVLTSTQMALATTEEGLKAGIRTMVDVLTAEKELFRAQRNHSDARHGFVLGYLSLKQVAGTLAHPDLETVNGWLKK